MSTKFSVGVIEDEDDIKDRLIQKLDDHSEIRVIGSASSVPEGIGLITNNKLDFVFMDIVIKEGDAFLLIDTLIKQGIHLPPIILNTGFADFEYAKKITNNKASNIIYLLEKPFYNDWDSHLAAILELVSDYKHKNQSKTHITIPEGSDLFRLKFEEICSIRVLEKGSGKCRVFLDPTKIKNKETVYDVNMTLSRFLKRLPNQFIQISRDTVINGDRIIKFSKFEQVVLLDDSEEELSVTNTFKDNIIDFLSS